MWTPATSSVALRTPRYAGRPPRRPQPPRRGSRRMFEIAWDALRTPGLRFDLPSSAPPVAGLYPATAALCQTLALAGRSLWVDQPRHSQIRRWCHRHTEARLVASPAQADFTLVTHPSRLPPLYHLNIGDGSDPATATTLLIQLPMLDYQLELIWSTDRGKGSPPRALHGLPHTFWHQREELQEMLPWGIDIFFLHDCSLVALPRTVHVEGSLLLSG